MKKTVLVTAIGTKTAAAIVRQLRKNGGFYIIGTDINDRYNIATSLDVDEYYEFPYSVNEEYIPFALSFCREHHVDYYYAVIDKEAVNLAKNRKAFEEIGTKLCTVNYEFAEICHFKNVFGEWIRENMPDIAIKEYRTAEEAEQGCYPLFIKPNEGVASQGCRKVSSYEELAAGTDINKIGSSVIVQEYISGSNITVDCVRNRNTGEKIQIQRRELLRNPNGCGTAVEIIHDGKLESICDSLMEKLDLNGVANMEFFDTGSGYRIIEINPRFSAGTMYSCMAGVDTVMNAMRIADNEPCEFGDIICGARFAERYETYRMDQMT